MPTLSKYLNSDIHFSACQLMADLIAMHEHAFLKIKVSPGLCLYLHLSADRHMHTRRKEEQLREKCHGCQQPHKLESLVPAIKSICLVTNA